MKLIALALCGLTLAACQTKTVEEMSYSERKELAGQIAARCYAQGVKAGSPEYEQCSAVEVQREAAMRRRAAAREDAAAAAPRRATSCQNFGGNVVCF